MPGFPAKSLQTSLSPMRRSSRSPGAARTVTLTSLRIAQMIDTDARAAVRRQLDLEEEGYALGAVRYRQQRPMPWRMGEQPKGQDEEANLPPGQHLLRLVVEPTAALLREAT